MNTKRVLDPYQSLESDESALLVESKQDSYNVFHQDDNDADVCLERNDEETFFLGLGFPSNLFSINYIRHRQSPMQIFSHVLRSGGWTRSSRQDQEDLLRILISLPFGTKTSQWIPTKD